MLPLEDGFVFTLAGGWCNKAMASAMDGPSFSRPEVNRRVGAGRGSSMPVERDYGVYFDPCLRLLDRGQGIF